MKRWLPILTVATALLLPSTFVFGQAKTKTTVDTNKEVEPTTDEKEEKTPTVAEQISKLISDKKLDDASELVDGLDQSSLQVDRFRSQIATGFARLRNYAGAAGQYEKQLQAEMAKDNFSAAKVSGLVNTLRAYMPRAGRTADVTPLIEEAIALVSTKIDSSKASSDMRALLSLHVAKSSMLRSDDKMEEAKALLQQDVELTQKLYNDEDSDIAAQLYLTAVRNLMPAVTDADARSEMLATHQALASEMAEEGNVDMALAFASASMSEVSRSYRSDPVAADAMLTTLKEFIEHHSENEKMAARLSSYDRSIKSIEPRIESAKRLLAMIGQPAPPMDADVNWVGVEQPIDTNGKVVLLDFWALWCGPCINTFPHLKHLTEEYGDKGFQIVGVTRYYNYTWDEEAGRAQRGDRDAEINPEVENEVLQKFLASHDLTHPTVVVSKESTMHKDFGVSGIPHVALLDQQGRIQMVKVGSGEANSQAIEAKIKELLGLAGSSKSDAGE